MSRNFEQNLNIIRGSPSFIRGQRFLVQIVLSRLLHFRELSESSNFAMTKLSERLSLKYTIKICAPILVKIIKFSKKQRCILSSGGEIKVCVQRYMHLWWDTLILFASCIHNLWSPVLRFFWKIVGKKNLWTLKLENLLVGCTFF